MSAVDANSRQVEMIREFAAKVQEYAQDVYAAESFAGNVSTWANAASLEQSDFDDMGRKLSYLDDLWGGVVLAWKEVEDAR